MTADVSRETYSVNRSVARAIDELRRGAPVVVESDGGALTILAVELADEASLAALEVDGRAGLIVAHPRAALLNITNQRAAAASDAVWIERAAWMDLPASVATADPVRDLATPFKGPFTSRDPGPLAGAANAAVRLAKLGGLLPAVFAVPMAAGRHRGESRDDALRVAATAILAHDPAATLRLVTRATLPLDGAPNTQVVAFRATDGGPEHLALLIGDPLLSEPVLTRLHSACLTGDVLGSLKCDCGPQLRGAVASIAAAGGGILLYLQQEGRGIGLINKLRAYALQDQGFDTVDANLRLGFGADERDFALAAAMLRLLGVDAVRLLTNNPDKVAGLEAGGIRVTERVPHAMPANPHNAHYLDTKRARQGHLL
ncbi:GTP cyclohydrolase II [Glacieibacterium frigidum]|uniref:GTP cyclohydrolase-2 n=1 Tax=Glacieibacterium frigidum TaxID=2593303 RepID=A0A552U9D7_9SPHN|nr:GTP cyclohydrolase II [Glacieibacterium frigidum]TRW14821.1 GTP cyclohydrolase II [Glacieibacterium frigidum]